MPFNRFIIRTHKRYVLSPLNTLFFMFYLSLTKNHKKREQHDTGQSIHGSAKKKKIYSNFSFSSFPYLGLRFRNHTRAPTSRPDIKQAMITKAKENPTMFSLVGGHKP